MPRQRDPSAFICHPFARPLEMKRALAEKVANSRRAELLVQLRRRQGLGYRTLASAAEETAHSAAPGRREGPPGSRAGSVNEGPRRTAGERRAQQQQQRRPAAQQQCRASAGASAAAPSNTAVCIAGSLRTFLQPVVQESFACVRAEALNRQQPSQ